jgi:hypothetical protein
MVESFAEAFKQESILIAVDGIARLQYTHDAHRETIGMLHSINNPDLIAKMLENGTIEGCTIIRGVSYYTLVQSLQMGVLL